MNPTAIYSKTGKGVQEASGKTSQLSRGDRAILSAIDGKITLKDLGAKFDRAADDKFFSLIKKMDADGFIREVSPGTVQRGAANAPKPAAKAPAAGGGGGGEELDFTQIFSAPPKLEKPPAPAAAAGKDPMVAAREVAEARARAEREAKGKADAAAKAISDTAQKERLDVEARAKASREAVMAAAAEGKTTTQIEAEKRAKVEAERSAKERAEREKIEAERSAKERAARELREKAEAADRARFESAERARREAEDLRRKIEEERRAREEAERRAREEAERTKREAEERSRREAEEKRARQEADELRRKLEEERKAREEAEKKGQEERDKRERERLAELKKIQEEEEAARKAREEQDRREEAENQRQIRLAREAEDKKRRDADARKKKEQEAKRWEQEEARRKSDDGYRQRAEQEDKERAAREEVEAVERVEAEKKAAEAADALAGSLLADLDSFSARQDEEKKEKEESERKARVEAERRHQEEQERREREEAERKQRKEEERRRKEEEERREKEEAERREKEAEEKKKAEEAEKKKREHEEQARRQSAPSGEVPISSADMDRGAVSDDERKLSPEARKALRDREREVARARSRGDDVSSRAAAAYKRKQPVKWGKPVAIALFFLLVGGVGVVNFMPLSTTEYEKLASDAVGVPVKIGAARMWVLAGVQMRFERVSIGDAVKIAEVRAIPEIDTLLGEDKVFSRLELDGVVLQQEAIADILQGGMKGKRLRVARLVAKEARLEGPLQLPPVDIDASIGGDGKFGSVKLSGERINGLVTPKGAEIAFDVSMGSFSVPFLGGKLSLADFGMKGVANRQGMAVNEFTGRMYDGTVAGNARIQWGAQWSVQGQIEGRSMNAAVFSPQLVSEGRFDGKGRYTMGGPDPLKLYEAARLDGDFTVAKGALGSFDLARALQSSSAQASGRTPFTELEGKVALANGALTLRDLELSSGLLKATGSLDIDAKGALAGRINAELRTLRGALYIGGSLTDPQLRR